MENQITIYLNIQIQPQLENSVQLKCCGFGWCGSSCFIHLKPSSPFLKFAKVRKLQDETDANLVLTTIVSIRKLLLYVTLIRKRKNPVPAAVVVVWFSVYLPFGQNKAKNVKN